MNRRAEFDTGPLSWVKGEIDLSMQRGLEALRAFAAGDAVQIKASHGHLHQAHGALQIVGLDGVTRLSEEVEALLDDIGRGAVHIADAVAAAERGFAGIAAYLDAIMAGTPNQPLRLYPLYRELRAARAPGLSAADPIDLYFPGLAFRPPWRDRAPVQLHSEEVSKYFRDQRTRFQRGLLSWLKGESAGAGEMHAAIDAIEQAQGSVPQRAFWWVATAGFDAIARNALPADLSEWGVDLRRFCNRVEGQMRRLTEGAPVIDERLMRETLYCVALARPDSDLIRQVQDTFQLVKTIPSGDAAGAVPAESPQLKITREHLGQAKDAWSRYAADTAGGAEALAAFVAAARGHSQSVAGLGNADFEALSVQIAEVGDALAVDPAKMSEAVALETATALLLAENALESLAADPASLNEAFGEQSRFLCARLQGAIAGSLLRTTPDIPLLDEMSRQAQERLVIEQVVAEMQANLRAIERVLDAFFRDTSQRDALASVAANMHQLTGALEMLGEARAHDALAKTELVIARLADARHAPRQEDFEAVAQTLSGLGFYIAALARNEAADFDALLQPMQPLLPQMERPAEDAPAEPPPVAEQVVEERAAEIPAPVTTFAAPPATKPAVVDADNVEAELLGIYLEEADEVLANIATQLARLRGNDADQEALITIRRGFHTLKGSGRMVGLNRLGEAAWTVEQALNWWLQDARLATPVLLDLIAQAARYFVDSVAALKAGAQIGDAGLLASLAEAVKTGIPVAVVADSAPSVPAESVPELPVESPVESSTSFVPVAEIQDVTRDDMAGIAASAAAAATTAAAESSPLPVEEDYVQLGDARITTTVFTIFSGEAHALVGTLRAEHEILNQHGIVTDEMLRAVHTLTGIAGTVELSALRELGHAVEAALEQFSKDTLAEEEQVLVNEAIEAIASMVESAVGFEVPDPAPGLVARLEQAALPPLPEFVLPVVFESDPNALLPEEEGSLARVEEGALAAVPVLSGLPKLSGPALPSVPVAVEPASDALPQRREQRLQDELDPQLLPLFIEEAGELVPAIDEGLRAWRKADGGPGNSTGFAAAAQALQRSLHTLKGSARMTGAMAVGEITHHMESRVEAALAAGHAQAKLHDELEASFDRAVRLLDTLRQPAPAVVAAAPDAGATPTMPRDEAVAAASMLRVRAEVVDRMVNQTGEIAIARSRIEGELRLLKTAMQELTDNVVRLRGQLREIEIQAESQMQSVAADASNKAGFDPLEFDRFTRFQELTRMMAESVNDVQTVHQNLNRAVDGTDAALAAQGRLNRELQQDLMRVRMVAFGTLSKRLYRIVRQTAKDVGKRANLDIRGGSVELDRAVLERITAPVEHMLRNAIVHGIEAPEVRAQQGKADIGEIRIEVSQEGSEMRLALSDDGAGLDLARIRAKAVQKGLLAENIELPPEELADLVFLPGFSTADELTQAAGRGVGMDVVRNEVASLGGRAELVTEPGKGMRVIVHLPLTLAVTQVVLVRAGERLLALPAVIVEQVMQYRPEQLAALYAARQVEWRGRRYALHYFPHLLGEMQAVPQPKRLAAVLLLRSGASAMAVHVDEIVGRNQEVVVKAIGPQLRNVTGVAGATVLGSGDIVLIMSPVALAARAAIAGAGAAAAPSAEAVPVPVPAMVMVVDDSLTVRKITSRLLERNGYVVVVAKDGVEALEKLQEAVPDVMLVDIEMPRMDGFDLTRNVRADARLAGLPIVMISSRTADKHQNYAHDIGVNVFLGKPYREDELLGHIAGFLKNASPREA